MENTKEVSAYNCVSLREGILFFLDLIKIFIKSAQANGTSFSLC